VIGIDAVVIVASYFLSNSFPAVLHKFRLCSAIWMCISSWLIVMLITEISKRYVGRPRPDIYARCGKDAEYQQCRSAIGDDADDEFKSWPSGHASMSMFGGAFAGLFFQRVVVSNQLWVAVIGAACTLLGFGVGATRIRDFRHHTDDVLAGLFLGWVCTYGVWSMARKRVFDVQYFEETAPPALPPSLEEGLTSN
jgi:phosphatidate phosphatase